MSATFTYGSYTSDNGEAMLSRYEVIPISSPRQERSLIRRRMHLGGTIIADTQANLLTRISQFIAAFDTERAGDAVLQIDGNDTPHYLSNSTPTGVRVASRSWEGKPEELVRSRTYNVVLETLEFAATGQIEEYSDNVQVVGTGGPDWRFVQMALGLPRLQVLSQFTPTQINQYGRSLGLQGYVLPTGPVLAALEQGKNRSIEYGSPSKIGTAYAHYPMRWRYVMQNSGPSGAAPIPK